MSSYETITLDKDGGVAVLTLNRPHAANTISRELMDEGVAALDELRADDDVRIVIITGAGERHFCGGADLRDAGETVRGNGKMVMPPRLFMNEIERLPQPVIAAINGACMGGGCEIALSCDFRIIAEEAQIGLTEISFGALPGGGGTQRLPRLIGVAKAKRLIYTGKRLTAAEALDLGLVDEVVSRGELMASARGLADELAQNASFALQAAKTIINEGMNLTLEQGLRLEHQVIAGMATPEQRQAAIAEAMERSGTYKNIFSGSKA